MIIAVPQQRVGVRHIQEEEKEEEEVKENEKRKRTTTQYLHWF